MMKINPMQNSSILKRKIMVIGAFRSGTNLMKHMLESHFETEVTFSQYFWKHSVPPTSMKCKLPQDLPIIVLTKDPARFNESLYEFWKKRRPNLDRGNNLSEFIAKPLIVYEHTKERMAPEYLFASPTDYWNQYHFSWLHWREVSSRLLFMKIEKLQENPHNEISRIANKFNLDRIGSGVISLPAKAITPSQDGKATKFAKVDSNERERLKEEDISAINERVNSSVASALGYDTY